MSVTFSGAPYFDVADSLDSAYLRVGVEVGFYLLKYPNRVPTRTGKSEKWEDIVQSGKSQGILNRLEKSGRITQKSGKLREFQTNIICSFSVIF